VNRQPRNISHDERALRQVAVTGNLAGVAVARRRSPSLAVSPAYSSTTMLAATAPAYWRPVSWDLHASRGTNVVLPWL
jgi:hypothetical protein